MPDFRPGQRWISESEPELGLGAIQKVTHRTVIAVFRASGEKREYALLNAPLRRVQFRAGDSVKLQDQKSFTVEAVVDKSGLLYYRGNGREICETELSDTISFNKPEERLFAAQVDPPELFDLRFKALEHQHHRRKSSVRGFVGGRVELVPHQLYIASEVSRRLAPRVLLADEVGLGKTIEACLILHRLIQTGRAQRVLIVVPDSLVHQWFVELLRRFNLWFHIFDEERCEAIEAMEGENPFADDQLVLCSISLFAGLDVRTEQALQAGWDLLVVDEAHHLGWSPEHVSPEYAAIETLGRKIPGLLLLTATPEQFGVASHFARLRLLDPDRFFDLDAFVQEAEHYREVARVADALPSGDELNALLDRHGTGRIVFRNTRSVIAGFPERIVHMTRLERPDVLEPEFDILAQWLADLLLDLEDDKVLLICRTQGMVTAIDNALRLRIKNVKLAVFHEGLSIVQRDRNAAWFADAHGARILICSEIGSEGRNFQFAHHLVLFDLPFDPELLEQRIGRLDRIGQRSEIHLHVPFISGTPQEVLARWHHEGLTAFAHNLTGGHELFDRFGARVYDLARRFDEAELQRLILETQKAREEITEQLHNGRDRLLELNSFRPEAAAKLVDEIRRNDRDETLDGFLISIFELYALSVEQLAPRTYKLGSEGAFVDSFPGLPPEGCSVTCDRQRALVREDIQFLTWDHPLVTGALDLLLGSEKGNSSYAVWPDSKTTGVCLEAIFLLECVAPSHLHLDRFLPPTPVRVIVDPQGNAIREARLKLVWGDPHAVLESPEVREDILPLLMKHAETRASAEVSKIVGKARREMNTQLDSEIDRLKDLREVNPSVRPEEIELLEKQKRELDRHLAEARLRLDAVRVIECR